MTRYTIQMLKMMNDKELMLHLIAERMDKLNPNAPLYQRLSQLRANIGKQA